MLIWGMENNKAAITIAGAGESEFTLLGAFEEKTHTHPHTPTEDCSPLCIHSPGC